MRRRRHVLDLRHAVKDAGLTVETDGASGAAVYDGDRRVARFTMRRETSAVRGALRELRRLGYDVPER